MVADLRLICGWGRTVFRDGRKKRYIIMLTAIRKSRDGGDKSMPEGILF